MINKCFAAFLGGGNGRIRASAQPERVRFAASRVRARKRGGVVLCGTSRERGENISVNDFLAGGYDAALSFAERSVAACRRYEDDGADVAVSSHTIFHFDDRVRFGRVARASNGRSPF